MVDPVIELQWIISDQKCSHPLLNFFTLHPSPGSLLLRFIIFDSRKEHVDHVISHLLARLHPGRNIPLASTPRQT
jgi:hypothetical protein